LPFSFLSPTTKTGEGERAAPAALGVRWQSEEWGKERGRHGKSIPGRSSSGGGPWELGHGGGRRRAAASVEVVLQGSTAARSWGKRGGDLGGSIAPLTLDRGGARRRLRGGQRGSAAMVGGGGVGSSGGCFVAVEVAVELGGEVEGLLIGVARRWSLAGRGWRPASGAGRL